MCDIVGHHHHPRLEETTNFKCLYDADLMTNLEENHNERPMGEQELGRVLAKSFLTESGKRLAEEVLLRTERLRHDTEGC